MKANTATNSCGRTPEAGAESIASRELYTSVYGATPPPERNHVRRKQKFCWREPGAPTEEQKLHISPSNHLREQGGQESDGFILSGTDAGRIAQRRSANSRKRHHTPFPACWKSIRNYGVSCARIAQGTSSKQLKIALRPRTLRVAQRNIVCADMVAQVLDRAHIAREWRTSLHPAFRRIAPIGGWMIIPCSQSVPRPL